MGERLVSIHRAHWILQYPSSFHNYRSTSYNSGPTLRTLPVSEIERNAVYFETLDLFSCENFLWGDTVWSASKALSLVIKENWLWFLNDFTFLRLYLLHQWNGDSRAFPIGLLLAFNKIAWVKTLKYNRCVVTILALLWLQPCSVCFLTNCEVSSLQRQPKEEFTKRECNNWLLCLLPWTSNSLMFLQAKCYTSLCVKLQMLCIYGKFHN